MTRRSFWVYAWAETVCYFLGHHWKSSYRRRDDGWKYRAKWRFKCRRCRMRLMGDGRFDPWYKELWWVLCNGWRALTGVIGMAFERRKEGRGYTVYPWWCRVLLVVVDAPAFAAVQAWGHAAHVFRLPMFPCEVFDRVADPVSRLIDRHAIHYYWWPPDSGRPDEVGVWTLRGVHTAEDRPRMFVTQGGGVSYTGEDYTIVNFGDTTT